MTPVTVAQLIEHLQKFDPTLPVCYDIHSEHCLLELELVDVMKAQEARPDGWVHDFRKDRPSVCYLSLP